MANLVSSKIARPTGIKFVRMARQTELTVLPVPTRIDRGDASKLAGYFFAAAFFAAQRFFKAATIAALPAALSTRFFLAGFATFGAFVST